MKKLKNLMLLMVYTGMALIMGSCGNSGGVHEITEISLLPLPQKLEKVDGQFILDKKSSLRFDHSNTELTLAAKYLKDFLLNRYELELSSEEANPGIELSIDASLGNDEAYVLNISDKGIEIKGKTPQAVFYGIQTLLQILPAEKKKISGFKIPSLNIADEPQFKWRGMHLDVCRHFFTIDEVKKLIDVASSLKINMFHWHLTEDQGWRIEIKKYPKLTEISAWRNETVIGHMVEHPLRFDKTRHGGFYTQDQIREVVEFAKSRFVTIVPEIEMPGHAVAALAAYPEFSCTGGPFEVFTEWGVTDEVFCAGKEGTFKFIEDVLSEVVELFPGEYVHIGGDECPKVRWNACPDCKNLMKTEKLKDANELQSYFIKRAEKFLNSKGKKLIGWDEILEGGLPERAAVMSWRGESGGIEAASHGHDVVMTPNADCYFDHYQGKYNEPLAIGGLTTLKDVYDYQPVPNNLGEQFKKHVLGSQANLWTEYIPTAEHLEYMIYPRLCALAENLWTSESVQNYGDFLKRMDTGYKRLDLYNINYRVNPPEGFEKINKFNSDSVVVELSNGIPSSKIVYTLDGTEPNEKSQVYEKPLVLNLSEKQELKAMTMMPSGKKSTVMSGSFEKLVFHESKAPANQARQGLMCIYFEDTVLSALKIEGKATKNERLKNFALPNGIRSNFFAVSISGFIDVPEDDVYTFYLSSDDGSCLYINNELVVNNDGFHWTEEKNGKIALKKGLHPVLVNYFQAKYGYSFGLQWESTKFSKQPIPDKMLFY